MPASAARSRPQRLTSVTPNEPPAGRSSSAGRSWPAARPARPPGPFCCTPPERLATASSTPVTVDVDAEIAETRAKAAPVAKKMRLGPEGPVIGRLERRRAPARGPAGRGLRRTLPEFERRSRPASAAHAESTARLATSREPGLRARMQIGRLLEDDFGVPQTGRLTNATRHLPVPVGGSRLERGRAIVDSTPPPELALGSTISLFGAVAQAIGAKPPPPGKGHTGRA